jgi:hypothetical protein
MSRMNDEGRETDIVSPSPWPANDESSELRYARKAERKWALLIAFHSRVFLPYCLAITANQSEEQP